MSETFFYSVGPQLHLLGKNCSNNVDRTFAFKFQMSHAQIWSHVEPQNPSQFNQLMGNITTTAEIRQIGTIE